ncbi:MAG: glutamate-5-semialdehyde dehydrogenase [Bacteroidetes bacterium]|nr:glutamate-5-semialdehyde dehydrogenase [Bacteroidota bacterium]
MSTIEKKLLETRSNMQALQTAKPAVIKAVLKDIADALVAQSGKILTANRKDLAKMNPQNSLYDRLLLNEARLSGIAGSIQKVIRLKDPTNQTLTQRQLENGLQLKKITTPLGVVAAIFESRPNVVADIATLCLKSRNACVLKGSKDAAHTNKAIVNIIHQSLEKNGLPKSLVYLLPPERSVVDILFQATRTIDVIIPRGSNGLIEYVRSHSRVPVIETGAGVCHVYIHKDADIQMGIDIAVNAKTQRPSVCNAMDTLLVDEAIAKKFLTSLRQPFEEKQVVMHGDTKSMALLKEYPLIKKANADTYATEFLSLACAVKVVKNIEEALVHIEKYGTRHSEAIVTRNKKAAEKFLNTVDAAAVYHNASTRFTDGEEFGLGAEVGISTQKLHARGPFALEKLVTEKWMLRGSGQIR